MRGSGVVALACLLPCAAGAQQPATDSVAAVRASALARLTPGNVVRLAVRGAGRVQGRFGAQVGDTLRLGDPLAPTRVPSAVIDTLWVRAHHTAIGAVVGGTVLAASTGSLMWLIGAVICGASGGEDCRPGTLALAGAIGGGLVGALMGGGLGTLFPRWSRRYP